MKLAGLGVRFLSMVYETVLLVALLLAATALFVAALGDSSRPPLRILLQLYLLLVTGIYLVWSWTGGRRTLAMRTWRIRLVNRDGGAPSVRAALVRYVCAVAGIGACAAGLLWPVIDPERQFLHDRIAGTRLVRD